MQSPDIHIHVSTLSLVCARLAEDLASHRVVEAMESLQDMAAEGLADMVVSLLLARGISAAILTRQDILYPLPVTPRLTSLESRRCSRLNLHRLLLLH